MFFRSMAHIAKDMGTPIVHLSWSVGYHTAQRLAMPFLLTEILLGQKFDQDF